jgi:hypothetical protein
MTGSVQERKNLMSYCKTTTEVKVLYLIKIYDEAFQTAGLVALTVE